MSQRKWKSASNGGSFLTAPTQATVDAVRKLLDAECIPDVMGALIHVLKEEAEGTGTMANEPEDSAYMRELHDTLMEALTEPVRERLEAIELQLPLCKDVSYFIGYEDSMETPCLEGPFDTFKDANDVREARELTTGYDVEVYRLIPEAAEDLLHAAGMRRRQDEQRKAFMALLDDFSKRWPKLGLEPGESDDPSEFEINGGDLVDWAATWIHEVRKQLGKAKRT